MIIGVSYLKVFPKWDFRYFENGGGLALSLKDR